MNEHFKKHRNLYSLLFLTAVAALIAWLFVRVDQLDAEVAKYSNRMEEHQARRPAVTETVEPEETEEETPAEGETE